jgi:hypothetical protein
MSRMNIHKPGKRMLMSDTRPHFVFHYPQIRATVFIRNICTVGARTRGRSTCKVSVTVTDLQAESEYNDKTLSNTQYETARNSSGYADVAQ